MLKSKRFWFLRNWQAWIVLLMGVVTAMVTGLPWLITLGIIGYLLVLLFEVGLDPGTMVRMLMAEQENRTMHSERSRLLGGIKELEVRNASLEAENKQLLNTLNQVKAELEKLKQGDQK